MTYTAAAAAAAAAATRAQAASYSRSYTACLTKKHALQSVACTACLQPTVMASLDMSDAFDVFQNPEQATSRLALNGSRAVADPALQSNAAEQGGKSAEEASKTAGLTVTMGHFTHSCAASL